MIAFPAESDAGPTHAVKTTRTPFPHLSGEALVADGSVDDLAWPGSDRVGSLLAALTDPQPDALELADDHGCSRSELAERLGVPLGTITSRMFAGLARLRELLDEIAPEDAWTPRPTS